MGVFSVPVKLNNWQNRFLPPEKQAGAIACEALVDSGAAELALPEEIVERLVAIQKKEKPSVSQKSTFAEAGVAQSHETLGKEV